MNLVSVRSGAAIVHEPFTAFALPERPPVPGCRGRFPRRRRARDPAAEEPSEPRRARSSLAEGHRPLRQPGLERPDPRRLPAAAGARDASGRRQPAAGRHHDPRPRGAPARLRDVPLPLALGDLGRLPRRGGVRRHALLELRRLRLSRRRRQSLEPLLLRLRDDARAERELDRVPHGRLLLPEPQPVGLLRGRSADARVAGHAFRAHEPARQPDRGLPPRRDGRGRGVGRRPLGGRAGRLLDGQLRDGALWRRRDEPVAPRAPLRLRHRAAGTHAGDDRPAVRQPLRRRPLRGSDDDGPPAAAEHRRDLRPPLPAPREVHQRRRRRRRPGDRGQAEHDAAAVQGSRPSTHGRRHLQPVGDRAEAGRARPDAGADGLRRHRARVLDRRPRRRAGGLRGAARARRTSASRSGRRRTTASSSPRTAPAATGSRSPWASR